MDRPLADALKAHGDQPKSEEMSLNDHCSMLVGIRNVYVRYGDSVFVAPGTWYIPDAGS